MIPPENGFDQELSRRRLLAAAGLVGGAAVAASLIGSAAAQAAPAANQPATPPVGGLHLQFGADAATEIVVSWHTLLPVRNPRVMLGTLDGKLDRIVNAAEAGCTDVKSGRRVYAYHAKLGPLKPDSAYLYAASHDGAEPEFGTFAPRRAVALALRSPVSAIGARRPPPGISCRRKA